MSVDPLVAELVKLRQAHQLTQREVAHRMGVTPGRIGHLESGYRTPNLRTLQRYAEAVDAALTATAKEPAPTDKA